MFNQEINKLQIPGNIRSIHYQANGDKRKKKKEEPKGLHVNAHKTEYMYYNQTGDISTLDGTSLKLVDKFTYLGSSVLSTEKKNRHTANGGMDSYR